jgi:hypothetical protein
MGYSVVYLGALICAVDDDGVVVSEVSIFSPGKVLSSLVGKVYEIHRRAAFRRQDGRCCGCGRRLPGLGECDHVIPRSRGRVDDPRNLKLYCRSDDPGGCELHRKKHGG